MNTTVRTDALGFDHVLPMTGSVETPEPGEVWMTTDDHRHPVVMIVDASPMQVALWPITAGSDNPSFPAFPLATRDSRGFTVWPQARFSMGVAGLSHRLGKYLHPDKVATIQREVTDRRTMLSVFAHPPLVSEQQWDELDKVCLGGWVSKL